MRLFVRLSVGLLVHPPVRLSVSHYMRLSLRLYVCCLNVCLCVSMYLYVFLFLVFA